MFAQPQSEHQWLDQLIGQWTFESQCSMGPGQPEVKTQGAESVRSLGGLWIVCEGRGGTPDGGEATMIISLGYDPAKAKYVGTFFGSCMTQLWIYEGALDSTGKILTLDTEGPSFLQDGKLAKYQDIIEIKSSDHRILRSRTLGDDGQWHPFMESHYRRVK